MYMAVTADKYELPLFVADTVWEMAKHFGVSQNTVYSSMSKGLSGKRNGYRFVKVEEVENELGGAEVNKYKYEVNYIPEQIVPFEVTEKE